MRPKHLVSFLILLVILTMLLFPAPPAHAGGVVSVCDETHLRAALSGGGTVTFACSGTIVLTSQIDIAANTTIDGSGQAVTISGNNSVRVFFMVQEMTLSLHNLTVANGVSNRGGGTYISDYGTLIVTNSTFSGNSAAEYGGGIFSEYNASTLTVISSTFSGNSAYIGGGIDNRGEVSSL